MYNFFIEKIKNNQINITSIPDKYKNSHLYELYFSIHNNISGIPENFINQEMINIYIGINIGVYIIYQKNF